MRIIDADELRKVIDTSLTQYLSRLVDQDDVLEAIDNTPTVDAEPVRHGHWEWFEEWSESNTEHYAECEDAGWKCSVCNKSLSDMVGGYWDDMDNIPKLNYCPNCGAKMDGCSNDL